MKRVTVPLLLLAFLMGLVTLSGCDETTWQDIAKQALGTIVKQYVLDGIEASIGDREDVIDWCIERLENTWDDADYLKALDLEYIIGVAYDFVYRELQKAASDWAGATDMPRLSQAVQVEASRIYPEDERFDPLDEMLAALIE